MRLEIDALKCGSAFDFSSGESGTRDLGLAVRLVELGEVLYLPNILEPGQSVCIVHGDVVPVESVLDCWAVGFVQEQKRRPQYAGTYAEDVTPDVMQEPVCVLGNLFSRNFGHWTEEL